MNSSTAGESRRTASATDGRKESPVRVNELLRSPYRGYVELNGIWDFALGGGPAGSAADVRSAAGVRSTGSAAGRADAVGAVGVPGTGVYYDDTIDVPGCLEAHGKGMTHAAIARPEWAGGPDLPHLGISWHRKRFALPAAFNFDRLMLNFGGVATDCTIWLNGRRLGDHHYAAVPFGFDVTDVVDRDGENELVVMVENRHTYAERTPTGTHGFGSSTIEMRWSGIYRGVELVGLRRASLRNLFLIPSAQNGIVECRFEVAGDAGATAGRDSGLTAAARVFAWKGGRHAGAATGSIGAGGSGAISVHLEEPRFWSDDDPFLYVVEVSLLDASGRVVDSLADRFGLRDIAFDGDRIRINRTPVYLRGDMSHYHWPKTIAFPTDRQELREKLLTYKQFGFNFVRHHTFFPSVEYLDVCDEIGLLCHNELGVASNSWSVPEEHAQQMWELLLVRDRNHPAVIIWCMGNEIVHEAKTEDLPDRTTVGRFAAITFRTDPTRLLQSNSPGFFVSPDGSQRKAPIHHELRKAGASYIDVSLVARYTGAARPWRMMWARERTKDAGLDHLLPRFVKNTQLLQARCRKIILEELRLNRESVMDEYYLSDVDYQGYELCTFRDSGSFVWGVVDDFFGRKIAAPDEIAQYNGATVLVWGRAWQRRCFAKGFATRFVPVDLFCSHFGKETLRGQTLRWEVCDEAGVVVAEGTVDEVDVACGEVTRVTDARWYFRDVGRPVKMTLRATLGAPKGAAPDTSTGAMPGMPKGAALGESTSGPGIVARNAWDFWLFPSTTMETAPRAVVAYDAGWELSTSLERAYPFIRTAAARVDAESVLIAGRVDETLLSHLRDGGRALLVGRNNFSGEVTEWGAGRSEFPRGTIIADHPLMKDFPHEGWCDIPFAGMISGSAEVNGRARNDCGFVFGLRDWPAALEPIITGIPSYKQEHPQKLGHLFEVRVGRGRLMVTSLDLGSFEARNPATVYFTNLLLRYLTSDAFDPAVAVEEAFIRRQADPANRRSGRERSATGQ